jgi:hypothetical protein
MLTNSNLPACQRSFRRLLKYWNGSRLDAEGVDGKERATQPDALLRRARRVASLLVLAGVARLAEIASDIGMALAP